jgi:hypothetical protein
VNAEARNIAALLRRSEGETLDFKQKNYDFPSGKNERKGELLKDVIALANACKESEAYILIGVVEAHGRAASIPGVIPTLKDNDVQRFVNSKTNRPVSIAVEHINYEGRTLTVIRVNQDQARPIFLRKDYGRAKANVVYIRHGSSTDEASPDEIGDMARDEIVVKNSPNIDLTFRIAIDAWCYSNPLPSFRKEAATYVDSFDVVAINNGNARAQHVDGSVTLPRGILADDFQDVKDAKSLNSFAQTKSIKLVFSNHQREPTAHMMMNPNPLEWKPILPGRQLCLLREQVLPLRDQLKELDAEIRWELAVDNCKLKTRAAKFSELVIAKSHSD